MRLIELVVEFPEYWGIQDKEQVALKKAEDRSKFDEVVKDIDGIARRDEVHSRGIRLVLTDSAFFTLSTHYPCKDNAYDGVTITSFATYMQFDVSAKLQRALDRLDLLTRRLNDTEALFNNHTRSPLTGNHLLSVNDVALYEDCCTDMLREKLAEGWRIIAVCPQEARRPDYILGRHIVGS